jgi:hypothetical protein
MLMLMLFTSCVSERRQREKRGEDREERGEGQKGVRRKKWRGETVGLCCRLFLLSCYFIQVLLWIKRCR